MSTSAEDSTESSKVFCYCGELLVKKSNHSNFFNDNFFCCDYCTKAHTNLTDILYICPSSHNEECIHFNYIYGFCQNCAQIIGKNDIRPWEEPFETLHKRTIKSMKYIEKKYKY